MRSCFYTFKERLQKAILLLVLLVPATVFAAQGQIVVKGKSLTLKQVIQQIEKNSNYTFFYKAADLNQTGKLDVDCEGNIEEILATVFKDNHIEYVIKGNEAILKNGAKESASPTVQQQSKKVTVKGVVKDPLGETIIGVSVVEKGVPGNGTVTDLDGQYTLTVSEGAELTISYIGYTSTTISLKPGVTQYNVTLKEDAQTLDEVVVVGYSTQKRESLTGALQNIKGDKLKDIATPSIENMLNGKVPGVYVAPDSGRPGSSGAVVIRGQATLNGTTDPLWVIDGIIVGSNAG